MRGASGLGLRRTPTPLRRPSGQRRKDRRDQAGAGSTSPSRVYRPGNTFHGAIGETRVVWNRRLPPAASAEYPRHASVAESRACVRGSSATSVARSANRTESQWICMLVTSRNCVPGRREDTPTSTTSVCGRPTGTPMSATKGCQSSPGRRISNRGGYRAPSRVEQPRGCHSRTRNQCAQSTAAPARHRWRAPRPGRARTRAAWHTRECQSRRIGRREFATPAVCAAPPRAPAPAAACRACLRVERLRHRADNLPTATASNRGRAPLRARW